MRQLLMFLLVCSLAVAQVPKSKHVWIVAEENHSYESLIGHASLPYYNSLVARYGLATQYYSPMHNSLAALFWLVAGEIVTVDNSTTSCFDVNNIVRQVLAKGMTWRSYQVDLPSPGFQGLFNLQYMRRHNPLIDFTDACTPQQKMNSVPFAQLATDIANHATPNFAYITPNADEDAHNGTLEQADAWLSENLPAILALPEFQPGGDGLLFIAWDEGDLGTDNRCSSRIASGCGGRVATLVIGPQVRPGFQSATLYTHANLLRTVCDAMSFASCPGEGALAAPMGDFFNTVAINLPTADAQVTSPVHVQATTVNGSPVFAMQVYVDDKLEYQTYNSRIDTSIPMASGSHSIVVQSWDKTSGIHKSGVNVKVQSEAVTVSSPTDGALVASPVGIVANATGQRSVQTMQVYVDDQLAYQVNAAAINTKVPMSSGAHHVVVQAWDDSGGITKSGLNITAGSPSLSVIAPETNGSVYSPVQIMAAAQDPKGIAAVQAYVDDTLQYEMTGTGMAAPISMAVGPHHLVAKSWNNAGQMQQQSLQIKVLPINVTVTSPTPNATVSSPVHIQASAPAGSTIFTMQVYVDSVLKYQTGGTSANVSLALSSGAHYIVAQAWDTVGGTFKSGVNITVP